MDCFYAAVEIRDNPSLRSKPVAVGGSAERHGVLTTCNYIARKYGLHSAMATAKGLRLCPDLVLLPVNMQKYRNESKSINKIFRNYTEIIEPLSLDEAYLDVSNSLECGGSATLLAKKIRKEIYAETQLTASAGIAPNKFLAKIASDWNKPNGQHTIRPHEVANFMKNLPISKVPGVGQVMAKNLKAMNISNCLELQQLTLLELYELFGKFGEKLFHYCRGIDRRPVETFRIRKSVSVENTYVNTLSTISNCEQPLKDLYLLLNKRLKNHSERLIHKQFVKIKFADFSRQTKECVVDRLEENIFLKLLIKMLEGEHKKIRLLGIGVRFYPVSSFQKDQLELEFL